MSVPVVFGDRERSVLVLVYHPRDVWPVLGRLWQKIAGTVPGRGQRWVPFTDLHGTCAAIRGWRTCHALVRSTSR